MTQVDSKPPRTSDRFRAVKLRKATSSQTLYSPIHGSFRERLRKSPSQLPRILNRQGCKPCLCPACHAAFHSHRINAAGERQRPPTGVAQAVLGQRRLCGIRTPNHSPRPQSHLSVAHAALYIWRLLKLFQKLEGDLLLHSLGLFGRGIRDLDKNYYKRRALFYAERYDAPADYAVSVVAYARFGSLGITR